MAQHEAEKISVRTRDALQAKKRAGFKLGTPKNLTDEARQKAWLVNKQKALDNPNNKRATGYIVSLRDSGFTYRYIADVLNEEGFRTARNRMFTSTAVKVLYDRAIELC